MRRRWLVAALAAVGIAGAMGGSLAASDGTLKIDATYRSIRLVVNGQAVATDQEPFIVNGRVYVPVRAVSEALGAKVSWDDAGSRVLIEAGTPVGGGSAPGAPAEALWRPFPDSNPWNRSIAQAPVDPNSDRLIASIGLDEPLHPDFGSGSSWDGSPYGFFVDEVDGSQAKVPIEFKAYGSESDPGPYPIPPGARVEGGPNSDGDRHVIVLDRANSKLYELYRAFPLEGGQRWQADSGAVWDLKTGAPRPAGWTSADAAGLPIYPGLVRYDEVAAGEIRHALRFTAPRTRAAYVPPASHWASRYYSFDLPPMGMRVRLKAGVDISGFSPRNQVILQALKTYGMMVADNGSPWYLSGGHDSRWNDEELQELGRLKGSDFEVVRMDGLVKNETLSR